MTKPRTEPGTEPGTRPRTEPQLVTLTIDEREVRAPVGANVVDAAHAVGIDIPVFCHHPRLEPVGMCRMCLVEAGTPVVDRGTGGVQVDDAGHPVIRMFPTLVAACTTPVSEGMVVRTDTDVVSEARHGVLEFLLTSHPLDCPICDKGGECPLQNQTMRYGPGGSRFVWGDKYRFPKPVPLGPVVALDRERCVLCARCIRFQDEVAGDSVLGFENRGRGMEIISFSDPPFRSYFSLNTTDICPVGALTSVDFRFQARAWELVARPSVCAHCAVGCNLMFDTRHGEVKRVMPRRNDEVNELWLCDKGRLAHHYAHAPERLTTPMVRRDGVLEPASWDEALGVVTERLQALRASSGADAIGGLAGANESNEDLYMLGRFMRAVVGTNSVDHLHGVVRDDVLLRSGAGVKAPPSVEALHMTDLGADTTVLVVGLDVEEESPILFLNLRKAVRQGAKVIVVAGRPQKLDTYASQCLRWRYGAQGALIASLLHAALTSIEPPRSEPGDRAEVADLPKTDVAERAEVAVPPKTDVAERAERRDAWVAVLAASLAAASAQSDAASTRPLHSVDAEALDAAGALVAASERLLIVYGQEAVEAGLVTPLAALAAALGRDGTEQNGLIAVGRHANAQGAADMGLMPGWLPGYAPVGDARARARAEAVWPGDVPHTPGADADAMLAGAVRGLIVVGADPVGEDPRHGPALGALDLLVVHDLFLTATALEADVVLPGQSPPEREGTFTNAMRRMQRFQAAVSPVGASRPAWRVFRDLGQRFGNPEAFAGPADVMDEIAQVALPYHGMAYDALGAPSGSAPDDVMLPFAPRAVARNVSYQGTAYANPLGNGIVWTGAPSSPSTDDGPFGWQPEEPVLHDGLVLVPATRLYDAQRWMSPTPALAPLVEAPYVELRPTDASALGLADGQAVRVSTAHGQSSALLRVREGVTSGVAQAAGGLAWDPPLAALLGGEPFLPVSITAAEA